MATVSMKVVIPEGLEFSALKLSRDPVTLDVEFDWGPIEQICDESGIDIDVFREQDPVQEMLLAEVQAEDAAGGQAGVINHAGGLQ